MLWIHNVKTSAVTEKPTDTTFILEILAQRLSDSKNFRTEFEFSPVQMMVIIFHYKFTFLSNKRNFSKMCCKNDKLIFL